MRWLGLPVLASVLLLGGCGSSGEGSGDDSSSRSASASPSSSSYPPDFELVRVLSATQAGGRVSTTAVPVPDVDATRRFAEQFGDSDLAAEVVGAVDVAQVPDGDRLYAAVVSLGCQPPTTVRVARAGDGFTIEAVDGRTPAVQCFAPVTSVALVAIAP